MISFNTKVLVDMRCNVDVLESVLPHNLSIKESAVTPLIYLGKTASSLMAFIFNYVLSTGTQKSFFPF